MSMKSEIMELFKASFGTWRLQKKVKLGEKLAWFFTQLTALAPPSFECEFNVDNTEGGPGPNGEATAIGTLVYDKKGLLKPTHIEFYGRTLSSFGFLPDGTTISLVAKKPGVVGDEIARYTVDFGGRDANAGSEEIDGNETGEECIWYLELVVPNGEVLVLKAAALFEKQ